MAEDGFKLCPSCHGAGDFPNGEPCGRCFGSGEVEVYKPNRYVRKPVAEDVEQMGLEL